MSYTISISHYIYNVHISTCAHNPSFFLFLPQQVNILTNPYMTHANNNEEKSIEISFVK